MLQNTKVRIFVILSTLLLFIKLLESLKHIQECNFVSKFVYLLHFMLNLEDWHDGAIYEKFPETWN